MAMETTFERLDDQEMINVVGGGERILKITDVNGNVIYIIVQDSLDEGDGN